MRFSHLTLIRRSLRYHWRAHVGVVLGAAVGSAALIGALVVGDSVRESLREGNLRKLGAIATTVTSGERFFTTALEDHFRVAQRVMSWVRDLDADRGPGACLMLPGTVARQDGASRANQVQVISTCFGTTNWPTVVTGPFTPGFRLSPQWAQPRPWQALPSDAVRIQSPGSVLLNEALARQLHAQPGETVVLRLHKPGLLPTDAAIADSANATVALRLKVDGIVSAAEGGDFSLQPSQLPPLNAFVRHDELSRELDLSGLANVLALGDVAQRRPLSPLRRALARVRSWIPGGQPRPEVLSPAQSTAVWSNVLEQVWLPADGGLSLATQDDRPAVARAASSTNLPPGQPSPPLPAPDAAALAALRERNVTLQSRRIFIDERIAEAARTPVHGAAPSNDVEVLLRERIGYDAHRVDTVTNGVPLLTYLVNLIRAGDRATPYSMVTAAAPPYVPASLRDNEIVVNQWLADDLNVRPGDPLEISYFVVDSGSALVERTNRFRVHSVVPLTGLHADRTLMPEFPGIARAERTQDWDTGFPRVHTIRDKDEAYWKEHRGTPKAFVSLAAGQRMWANRFGTLTAIRYPLPEGARANDLVRIVSRNLLAGLTAAEVGLTVTPARLQALNAASQSQDFGGLFLGFSFFLIVAALILMGLLFQFGLEQRAAEIGTLLALGFPPRLVRRLFLGEGMALAGVGGLIGMLAGLAYARAMLRGLATVWRDAVSTSALEFHVTAGTLLMGALASVAVCVLTIWLTLRKQARQPARALLAGELTRGPEIESGTAARPARRWLRLFGPLRHAGPLGALALAGAAALIGLALANANASSAGSFFGAGSLLLISGLAFTSAGLRRLQYPGGKNGHEVPAEVAPRGDHALRGETPPVPPGRAPALTPSSLALRALARRRNRSLAVATLLACGSFLIAAIGAFKLDADRNATQRSSGTGGFALLGQSSLPIVRDLNTEAGRDFYALNAADLDGVRIVPMRVREGDDASCLNLNRAQRPRLLGVDPAALAERRAFTFAQVAKGYRRELGWELLLPAEGARGKAEGAAAAGAPASAAPAAPAAPAPVPAIGDLNSILWAMGKRVGDTIDYLDERGEPFQVRLVGAVANSILQGNLVIAEDEWIRRFPSQGGYRQFLIDAPTNRVDAVAATLSRALQDAGLELVPAARRLAEFNAVQNTYLNTFQVLGGLGLLLGSAGLGVVVLRNVLERRSELALLLAVGFRRRTLRWLVLGEHGALLAVGLAVGILAAVVAILPQLLAPGAQVGWASLIVTLMAVLVSGLVWTGLATVLALRGPLLDALRNE